MLKINGIEIQTSIRAYTCLDCGQEFVGRRNMDCPHCASGQTMPTSNLNRRHKAELVWLEARAVTEAPFTTG
jgi:hypothetical protein